MRMGSIFLLLLVFSSAAGTAQEPSPPVRSDSVHAPTMPGHVSGFRLSETRIHADPQVGTWYTYLLGGRRVTANVAVQPTVTPGGESIAPDSVLARAVRQIKTLPQQTDSTLMNYTFIRDEPDTLVLGSRRLPGHVIAARVRQQGRDYYRAWHIYLLGSRYVRVMTNISMTGVPVSRTAADQKQLAAFVRDVVPAVLAAWQL